MVKSLPFDGTVQDAELAFSAYLTEDYDYPIFKPGPRLRLEIRPVESEFQERLCVLLITGTEINSQMAVEARYTPKGTVLQMSTTSEGAWYELAGEWERLCDFLTGEGWIKPGANNGPQGQAGRKPDRYYDLAYEMIRKGTPQLKARDLFFEQSKIVPDAGAIKAFNKAMSERRKKATK